MKLQIIIDEKGNIIIENTDTIGPGCTDIANKLAEALGKTRKQDLKQEYYELPVPDLNYIDKG